MSGTEDTRRQKQSNSPVHNLDESNGSIKDEQRSDRDMRRTNVSRGSEPETRAASTRR
jgi:hypothetical protein